MEVNLIVPCFASDKEEEIRRLCLFNEWYIRKFIPELEKLSKDAKSTLWTAFSGQLDAVGSYLLTLYKGLTPKGMMLKNKLSALISKIDYSETEDNYIILIDGSGKIDYDSVFKVLNALIKGKQTVLGCRQKGNFGITEDRKNIELFENFIVSEIFKVHLPDAQCGCWGFRIDVLRSLPFTAQSYELELDLVTSALQNNLSICFVPVKVIPKLSSDFNRNPEIHLVKLNFIVNKLRLSQDILGFFYKRFKEVYNIPLPEYYPNYFKQVSYPKFKIKFECFGECEKACKEVYSYKGS